MINVATITQEFINVLNDDDEISLLLYGDEIRRGEYINENPSHTPWIGVYRNKVEYEPRTLGESAENWQGTLTMKIIAQVSTSDSAQDCEDRLEDLVQKVLVAVLNFKTINNEVDMLNSFDVSYSYNETDSDTLFFQNAEIELEYEVSTT